MIIRVSLDAGVGEQPVVVEDALLVRMPKQTVRLPCSSRSLSALLLSSALLVQPAHPPPAWAWGLLPRLQRNEKRAGGAIDNETPVVIEGGMANGTVREWDRSDPKRPMCTVCGIRPSKKKGKNKLGRQRYTTECRACARVRKLGEKRQGFAHPNCPISALPEGPEKDRRRHQQKHLTQKNGRRRDTATYRQYLKDQCEQCGFLPVERCQLDAHHRDGNHRNNTGENIVTLCANCHRLQHWEGCIGAWEGVEGGA